MQSKFPTRFRWKTRLFVGAFLIHMLGHSFLALTPYDEGWDEELGMDLEMYPVGLPTEEELRWIDNNRHSAFQTRRARWMACATSFGRYFLPWPSARVRPNLESSNDWGKWSITWIASRLFFAGSLVGVEQDWPMFSPDVGDSETLARFRLVYLDGGERVVRIPNDPKDLTRFTHWWHEKDMQIAGRVLDFYEARLGYCKMLAKRHPVGANKSPLKTIFVYSVSYAYPPRGEDPKSWFQNQNGPPRDQVDPPAWAYDVRRDQSFEWDEEYEQWIRE